MRAKAFTEVQKILCEELPQIWLMELAWPTIHDKKLHNVIQTAMGPNAPSTTSFSSDCSPLRWAGAASPASLSSG